MTEHERDCKSFTVEVILLPVSGDGGVAGTVTPRSTTTAHSRVEGVGISGGGGVRPNVVQKSNFQTQGKYFGVVHRRMKN